MALPWLEIMEPRIAHGQSAAPQRFLSVYSPNGYVMDKWTPTGTGTTWTSSPILQTLDPFRSDINVISGLGNWTASITTIKGGAHTRSVASLLTQTPVAFTTGANVNNGISVDQVIAKSIGNSTRFPSIQVGSRATSTTGDCEDGFSCAYQTNISWSGPSTPLIKQTNPRDIFNRLFGDGPIVDPMPGMPDNRYFYQKSILDVVRERANSLRGRLGATDKLKLDEYFNGVREVETRIARLVDMPANPGSPTCQTGMAPADLGSVTFPQQLDLISDLIVLAFQCDVTRVATYMYEHPFTDTRVLDFLPGVTMGHHDITHSSEADQELAVSLFYYERFAYLLGKLKGLQEAGGSVLDNSVVYFTSEFGNAHAHDMRSLAIVVAGKAGGKFKTGQHIRYPLGAGSGSGLDGRGNRDDKQIAQLHLTVLHAFGINEATFGHDDQGPIGTTTLPEIVV